MTPSTGARRHRLRHQLHPPADRPRNRADKEALARVNTITRLGRGVDASGALDPDAIERTVDGALADIGRSSTSTASTASG